MMAFDRHLERDCRSLFLLPDNSTPAMAALLAVPHPNSDPNSLARNLLEVQHQRQRERAYLNYSAARILRDPHLIPPGFDQCWMPRKLPSGFPASLALDYPFQYPPQSRRPPLWS